MRFFGAFLEVYFSAEYHKNNLLGFFDVKTCGLKTAIIILWILHVGIPVGAICSIALGGVLKNHNCSHNRVAYTKFTGGNVMYAYELLEVYLKIDFSEPRFSRQYTPLFFYRGFFK